MERDKSIDRLKYASIVNCWLHLCSCFVNLYLIKLIMNPVGALLSN